MYQTEFNQKLDEARDILDTLSTEHENEVADLNQRIEDLEKEVENLKEENSDLDSTNSELQEKIDEYERETSN